MGLKKVIERWNTGQTNEYWKHVRFFLDEKNWKIQVTFDGYKNEETRREEKDSDDSRTLEFDINDIFTKKQLDDLKTRIYKASVKSMPIYEERWNEEIKQNEQIRIGENNPFVDAEEA